MRVERNKKGGTFPCFTQMGKIKTLMACNESCLNNKLPTPITKRATKRCIQHTMNK